MTSSFLGWLDPENRGELRLAKWRRVCYIRAMETPINLEETPGKVVGKRRIRDPFEFGMKVQRAGKSIPTYNGLPKGVYKFHSHEEADQWIIDQLAKRAAAKAKS